MDFNFNSIFGENLMKYFAGIDFESFVSLDKDQIKEAIPDVIPRIIFENKFKKFQETIAKTPNSVTADTEPICVVINPNETTNLTSDIHTFIDPTFDKDFESFNIVTGPVMASKTVLPSQKPRRNEVAINTVQDIIDIPSIELKIVITNCIQKQFVKENNDRVIVGKEIIHHLLVNNLNRITFARVGEADKSWTSFMDSPKQYRNFIKIDRSEFKKLAKLVVQLFPKELEGTYYIPSVKGSPAQGKLYSAYSNYRNQLIAAGLIVKKYKETTDDDVALQVEKVQLKEKSDALKVCLEESLDFDHVKTCWKACHNERQKFVNEFSTYEYMNRFPTFDLPLGYELLMLDADIVLADKKSMLLKIAPKIITFAYPKRRRNVDVQNLITAYEELKVGLVNTAVEFQIIQQLIAIRLLPHVMPNPKKKLSKTEVERLFCPYTQTELDADAHISSINADYKGNALILKPRILFIGDISNPFTKICIASKQYTIQDPLIGFDIFFKSFLALKCEYPEETNHIWQFIEKSVYGLEYSKSKKVASVDAFIHDIETMDSD